MTISEAINNFYARIGGQTNTLASYRVTLEPFKEKFGNRNVPEILPAEVREYLKGLKISESTRYLRFSHIKALFNRAIMEERIKGNGIAWENPCKLISDDFRKPENESAPIQATIHADMQAVRLSLNQKYQLIFDIGARGALRIEEILSITPDTLIREPDGACCIRIEVKGGKIQNKVIPPDLCDKLHEYIEEHGIGKDERLFKMTRSAVWQVLKARGIEPHDLRRYAAYRAMEMGKDMKTIQGLLGHASPATTMIYLRNLSVSMLAKKLVGM